MTRGDVFVDPFARREVQWVCVYANECRALVRPVQPVEVTIGDRTFTRPATAVNVSPNATVRIVGRMRLPKDTIRLPRRRR